MQELFIDWDLPRVTCVEVSRSGEDVMGVQVHEFVAPEDLGDLRRSRELGEWLARELSLKQLSVSHWTVILPRDRVMMRRLELPGVPEAEIPIVVPFQMATQLGTAPEMIVVDYLPNHPGIVMAASLPSDVLGQIRAVATLCSATIDRILVSSCLVSAAKPDFIKKAVVIWADQHRIESVWNDGYGIAAASCRRRNSQADLAVGELAGEVRRLLMNVDTSGDEVPVFVWGQAATLVSELAQKLDTPVSAIDSELVSTKAFKGKVDAGLMESQPAIGKLALLGLKGIPADKEQVDFLSPRKSAAKKDRRMLYGIIGGVAAVLVIGVGTWIWNSKLAELDDEISTLQTQITDGNSFIKARDSIGIAAGKIDKHVSQQVELSNHFSELLTTLPGTRQLFLTSYSIIPLTGEYRARVVASGVAKRRIDVELFFEQLNQKGLRVKPSPIDEETKKDRDYPVEFKLELDIPSRRAVAASPKKETPRPSQTTAVDPATPPRS
jgi:hypothetical protein